MDMKNWEPFDWIMLIVALVFLGIVIVGGINSYKEFKNGKAKVECCCQCCQIKTETSNEND